MTNEVENVPELRFPEFEYEWVQKKIDNLTTKIGSGKTPKGGSANYLSEGIPFFRSQNIQNGYLNLNDLVYIDSEIDESMKNSKSYFGDILLNITGASIGRSAINTLSKTHININQHVCIIRLKKEFSFNFLGQFLLSPQGQKKIFKAQSGGSREGLNFKEIGSIKVNIPKNFNEQEKIGVFFSKLDRQIELEEKKLELLEQQKRGYMQKLFSQDLRFKDENENDYPDWEETTLKNITNYISSKKSSNQYNESNNSEGYPVYDAIQEIGKDLQYDMKEPYISILKDGAGVGRLNLRAGKSSVIGTMGYIQANNVDIQFLYYRMKLLNFRKFIIGSTIPHLYYKDYSKEKILIPTSNDEQKKIGHFILNKDKLINNKTLKLDYLKQRKQGLLQKMFI
ncbi:restriction endonuclease subunit S [Staphylococcus epidermidis]|uniref:restriction endonuclease subunit S n=1 Tax=Staphylococcus epidermidis TaxID=1282 RepID=UPI000D1C2277|nr:restriction endonuclease subunit S [Staphylococcus epidermidis]MCE5044816.1 restriction endonuclease subunit S [Staphylococcus epidermidis]MCE5158547.1 restriction endonuclease subunit S [Staphylococcus epidermidis]MCG2140015.1 restriction endonuclease subunit S [Staphylococcus epidermidis]MCG2142238.1 restriction endonuclease subunit S [Staphylococcus epidermidis]MCG2322689.1 restriction endonuclease subunit S [Staphylococcus epidermidis]